MNDFLRKLDRLDGALPRLRRGIEKEGLRVRRDGTLATTPHPTLLGSALTHPSITTDFSESQLELITGVHERPEDCLRELTELHQVVYRSIGDEIVWAASMPCSARDEASIPIARYGDSNVARAKTVYRIGLAHRYGRRMQLISGIHYNFSLPDDAWRLVGFRDANEAYFALIRNFRRRAWMLLYLFGASPAVCASFLGGRSHSLVELAPGTLYLPYATSLRMGRIGYLGEAQQTLAVSCNDLESYAATLTEGLTRPYPPYEAIGLRQGDDYRQLATTLLQIENEYYTMIRPKRVTRPGERPLHALRERGVQYVEVRVMDIDPFLEVGISAETMRFLDVFLLHCLLSESPPDTPEEIRASGRNAQRIAARGREPGLRLSVAGRRPSVRAVASRLIEECMPIARAIDAAAGGDSYATALALAGEAVADPGRLPSARMLTDIRDRHRGSYTDFVIARSTAYRDALLSAPLPANVAERYSRLAAESIEEQRRIEAADDVPFEAYRQRFLAPDSLIA